MLRIAVIADVDSPNGKLLSGVLSSLDGRALFVAANDMDTFRACDWLSEVEVILPVAYAHGNMSLIADLWEACPRVRWVHSLSAGVDSIVPILNSLSRPDVPLTNAKAAFSSSLAEYTLAAMLHFNKQVPRLQAQREQSVWDKFIMHELRGKTVGFVGFGDIAQTTVPLCRAFGMQVLALRQSTFGTRNDLADAVYYSQADRADGDQRLMVFRESDFVVCSLPGSSSTRHFCGAEEFAVMKPTGVFISLGRGTCVDEAALATALQDRRIAGAALDVFEVEPLPSNSPLWSCENLLMSPHNADLTTTHIQQSWNIFLQRLDEFQDPRFAGFASVVDKDKGY